MSTVAESSHAHKYQPRTGAKLFFAEYEGFHGIASIDDALTVIFKTPGTAWYPIYDMARCILFGLVDQTMQAVILDDPQVMA